MQFGNNIDDAALAVGNDGIIAYPTEGVFGLGCNPDNDATVDRLINLKERSADKGLILIAADRSQLSRFTGPISKEINTRLDESWPGATTWILPAAAGISPLLTGGRDTIAARVTAFPTAAKLCRLCGHALISTSANRSGSKPCSSASQVQSTFEYLDYIVDLPVGTLHGPTPIFDGISGKQLR